MNRMSVWWWLTVSYGITFPLLVVALHLREGAAHSLTPFFLVSLLCAGFALVWVGVSIYRVTIQRSGTFSLTTINRIGFALLAALLWVIMFALHN